MSDRVLQLLSIGRWLFVASAFLLLAMIPTELVARGPTLCLFKSLLGIECLGCGMTRALSAVLHGNLVTALSYNRLVVVVFPLLCFALVRDMITVFRSRMRGRCIPGANTTSMPGGLQT